jgi:hypothetical protein
MSYICNASCTPSLGASRDSYHRLSCHQSLRALSPVLLAPIRRATKVGLKTRQFQHYSIDSEETYRLPAKVTSRTAQPRRALLVHYRAARLSFARNARGLRRFRRRSHAIALSKSRLTSCAAIQILILQIILWPTVPRRGTASVEIAVCTGARAGHAALCGAADVYFGNGGGEGGGFGAGFSGKSRRSGLLSDGARGAR